MKTYLYLKTQSTSVKMQNGYLLQCSTLAVSSDGSSPDILIQVNSDVLDTFEVKAKIGSFGDFITATEALALGHLLQPDRDIYNPNTGEEEPYTFTLQMTLTDLKNQCSEDIKNKGENKAHSLGIKKVKDPEEQAIIDEFLATREAVLAQYETDKTNLGL